MFGHSWFMKTEDMKKVVGRVLGLAFVRRFLNCFCYFLYKLLSFSNIIAIFYSGFVSRSFSREQRAFNCGALEYYKKLREGSVNSGALRRNIHRLEKAMLMCPIRPVFGIGYIGETMELYKSALDERSALDSGELEWSHDVLGRYFEVVDDSHPLVRKWRDEFLKMGYVGKKATKGKYAPYDQIKRFSGDRVSYDDFLALSKQRRSVRWYKRKKVPRALIDKAIEAASLSPSACNRQPFEYRVYDDAELVKKISGVPFGTAGYADNIPVIVVLVGDMSNFFSARDRHLIYIDASLSVMAFMYALETLGLSSCAINWPDLGIMEKRMSKVLDIKPFHRVVMLVAVGYPREGQLIAYSKKKNIDGIRSYNKIS
jgi:nitroreductase